MTEELRINHAMILPESNDINGTISRSWTMGRDINNIVAASYEISIKAGKTQMTYVFTHAKTPTALMLSYAKQT